MDTNKILIDYIIKLKIKYKKETIEFKPLEKLILKSFNDILNNKNKKILFIGIEKELTSILLILILSIKQYSDNMKNPDNNILDTVENGDKVFYRGQILIFDKIDIDERDKNKYIYLLGKNKCTTLVPFGNSHLLTMYNGQANRINKIDGNSQRYNITRKFISEIMGIDYAKLNGVIKESTIIVFEHKDELYKLIDSLEIDYEDKNYTISQLFPFAYYTSEENHEYFKGNRIKENTVIKFVSSISTAIDIIKDDKNIKNIILIGEKTYRDALETELREASMIDSIDKILVIDTWESNFDFSLLLKDDEHFSVYAITKEVVLDNINLFDESLLSTKSSLQKTNYNLMKNLVNKNIYIYEVNNCEILNKNIYNISKNLKVLFEYSDNSIKILDFIKRAYYLCNKVEQSVLPLNKCKTNLDSINYSISILRETLGMFPKERVEYKLMQDIISQIEESINSLEVENYKIEVIKKKFLNNKKSLLGIKNIDEFIEIEDYFRKIMKKSLDIKKLDKIINVYGYSSLIIPCFLESKHFNVLNTNIVENVEIIVYRREKNRINSLIRKNNKMLELVLRNNKLLEGRNLHVLSTVGELSIKTDFVDNKEFYDDEEKFNEIEDKVQRVIQENKINLFINEDKVNRGISNSTMKVNKIVTFEDDNYSLLSNNYKTDIVDIKNKDIKQKSISELAVGDDMIFTKSKLSGEKDIVKVVIRELLDQKKFRSIYGEYFELNNLWKNCLNNYMHIYGLTEQDISNEFQMFGKKITSFVIVNWLNGNIIGPQDLNDIKIIAGIVKNVDLDGRIDEVITACKQERKIQIQVRKAIAKIILNSVVNNNEKNNDIYEIVKNTISDLDRYAYIGTISSIKNIHEEISSQHVNKVIEG